MSNQIPEWRMAARAGVSLAAAEAAAKPASGPVASVAPTAPAELSAPAPGPQGKGNPDLMRLLRPNVRDRWLATQLSYYTPEIVMNTIRGAMAGNLMSQWLMFDLMEQTWGRLTKNLNELKNAVVDLDWNVQAHARKGEKPTDEAQKRARVVDDLIWSMRPEADADENDFEDTLRDVMDGIGKGISVLETGWERRDVIITAASKTAADGTKGESAERVARVWAPRATWWVHPRYYGYPAYPQVEDRLMLNVYELAQNNPQVAVLPAQLPDGGLWMPFPRDQFILGTYKMKSGHPVSGALLRILGFHWAATNFCWEWFLNLAQLFGVPIRWATYATGTGMTETIDAIEEMLSNLGSAGWGAFPEGTKVELLKAVENARDNPAKAFIDAADQIADLLILGQTLTSTQGERGSQSLGTIHKDVRDEKIMAVAKRTAKVLNHTLVRSICVLNFGDDRECPWLQPAQKQAKDSVAVATKYKTVLSIPGVAVSKQQFYEENDLVVPAEGDDVLIGQASGGGPGSTPGDEPGSADEELLTPTADGRDAAHTHTARATDATEQLVNRVIEDLTGVEEQWLGGVKPAFRRLCAAALSAEVTDAEFVRTLERAQRQMPELFGKLKHEAVATALEKAMGAGCVNGAVKGYLRRKR